MHQHTPTQRRAEKHPGTAYRVAMLLCCMGVALLVGCKSEPKKPDGPVVLPGYGNGPNQTGVYGIVLRYDIPLNTPTDKAWQIINEQAIPALTRGAWRGNGLRLGILRFDQLKAYDKAMPNPLASGTSKFNQSSHPIPIIQTSRLSSNLRFEVDLTRPPKPLKIERVAGGKGSTLRLLARIETEEDGRHTLVLTPHHHIPSKYNLLPRDALEKELDGRIFKELSVRLTLDNDHVAVVGLYWPWPENERSSADTPTIGQPAGDKPGRSGTTVVLPPASADDPAAPPPHLATPGSDGKTNTDKKTKPAKTTPPPEDQRLAPPLPTSFGSVLLTGTRITKPARSVLLISIVTPKDKKPAGKDKKPGAQADPKPKQD